MCIEWQELDHIKAFITEEAKHQLINQHVGPSAWLESLHKEQWKFINIPEN